MITKWKQYKCVINKHILDVHCVRLHNYVHWLSILLYQEKKFILNQTHVVLEVFFSVFQNMTKSLNCQILFQKMNALKAQCTSILSCPRRKSKERKKKELNFPNQCLPSWSSSKHLPVPLLLQEKHY